MPYKPEDFMPSHGRVDDTLAEINRLQAERLAEEARYKMELLDAVRQIRDAVTYLAEREKARGQSPHPAKP
jgi:hypothetical protein